MRAWLPLTAVLALAACDPQIPDSGAGVGFGDYGSYQQQLRRDTALATSQRSTGAGPAPVASAAASPSAEAPTATGAPSAAEIDVALGRTPAPAPAATLPAPAPIQTAAITPAPVQTSGTRAISDENDFQAVSSRESIESDAERLARQRAQYQEVPVQALPGRPQDTGPNLAEYALSTTNPPGQQVYRRGFTTQRKYDRACSGQPSASSAQQAFLSAGGPEKDRLGMDPDGDGFACAWDPRPFRAAKG